MTAFEIGVVAVVAAAFVAAVVAIIVRKIRHKGGCDCGCEGCPHSCKCHSADGKEER